MVVIGEVSSMSGRGTLGRWTISQIVSQPYILFNSLCVIINGEGRGRVGAFDWTGLGGGGEG